MNYTRFNSLYKNKKFYGGSIPDGTQSFYKQ